jgi:NAD(P)-dependent dehydrogenase (short-subunit alcohol dehydrogenase family)
MTENSRISGAAILVTGAASGLGEASARYLHARGASVAMADLNADRGNEIAAELGERANFTTCNVIEEDDVKAACAAAQQLGRFSAVVHCAGGGIAARTLSRDGTPHDLDAFKKVIDLNLIGTFNVVRLAAAAMSTNEPDEDGERGVIVNTASIAAFEGQIGQIAYGSAKAGIVGMTLIAARDLGAVGVRVNTIAPGTMGTPMMMNYAPKEMIDGFTSMVPFPRRLGYPDEFAELAASIISNHYLNGTVIRLDGGTRFPPK